MHSWGINLRYFGRVRRELHRLVYAGRENASGLILNKKWEKNFRFLDSLLLTEMTTRVVKDIFHEQMRYPTPPTYPNHRRSSFLFCSLLSLPLSSSPSVPSTLTTPPPPIPLPKSNIRVCQQQSEEGGGAVGGALSPGRHQTVQPHHRDVLA